jgi:hypothetical protein
VASSLRRLAEAEAIAVEEIVALRLVASRANATLCDVLVGVVVGSLYLEPKPEFHW